MNDLRKTLKQITVIQRLSSIKITVVCIFLLFVLVLWGTIAQVSNGLYQSQERFFFSWYFLALGFIPFPGARLVLWVMFINLACVSITRFVYKLSHLGIVVIHIGLLTYFVSAFVIFHGMKESQLTLLEGEESNVSEAYHHWELSMWAQSESGTKEVTAFDDKYFKPGQIVSLEDPPIKVTVKKYFNNADAYTTQSGIPGEKVPLNASGITTLASIKKELEGERNLPGGIFEFQSTGSQPVEVLLYAGEMNPTPVPLGNTVYNVQLRRRHFELPFSIKLKDFRMEVHPGTQIAKSYESLVDLSHENVTREVLIWMNHPLRFKDYTLYQASYSIDGLGRERSTLAVVKNIGWIMPYVSSFLVFAGLVLHFLMMAFTKKKKA